MTQARKMAMPAREPLVDLQRRQITVAAALALLGGATVTLTGCGGGSPAAPSAGGPPAAPPPTSSCPSGAVCGRVGDPSHEAVITGAQLAAGGALVLNIQGQSNHNHTVELSGEEVVAIRERRLVQKTSSTTLDHQHVVTFNA